MPDQYAIPWVTVIETPEGNELRVKMKRTLSTIQLVKVPGGTVEMPALSPDGQIERRRKQAVQIKPFWIGKTELTWDFYDGWLLEQDLSEAERKARLAEEYEHRQTTWSRPSKPLHRHWDFGREGYAAITVHPKAAVAFCRWMSQVTGETYRLPTEAEWEYACRAGAAVPTTEEELAKIAWFDANSEQAGQLAPRPVGRNPANAFGLHDMLGNVGEWVTGIDGQYVLKGGSFESSWRQLTPAFRATLVHDVARTAEDSLSAWWLSVAFDAGFRIVREEKEE